MVGANPTQWILGGKAPAMEIVLSQNSFFCLILSKSCEKQRIGIRPPNGVEPRAGQAGNIRTLFRQAQRSAQLTFTSPPLTGHETSCDVSDFPFDLPMSGRSFCRRQKPGEASALRIAVFGLKVFLSCGMRLAKWQSQIHPIPKEKRDCYPLLGWQSLLYLTKSYIIVIIMARCNLLYPLALAGEGRNH